MPGKEPEEKGRLEPTKESRQSISDAELDKMIDQSVDNMKKEKDTEKNVDNKIREESDKKKEDVKKEKPKKESKSDTKPVMKPVEGYDPWQILQYPHLAEKSMNMVEMENKLVFVVRRDARKDKIKEAVEKGFGVRVLAVNVTITRKGHKKAYIKLDPNYSAADIATRLGMI